MKFSGVVALALAVAKVTAQDAPPVPILVLSEALCPGCEDFVTGTLNTTFYEIGEIMNITAVPYGNAQIDYTTETVTCQHGEQECSANVYEQCGMYLYPDQAVWMPYYVCLESKGSGEGGGGDAVIAAVPECATAAGMDATAVEACHADSALAWQLQQQAAAITEAADHTYTPWVVVDGTLLNYDFMFKRMICSAYTGTPPAGCASEHEDPKRCYKD